MKNRIIQISLLFVIPITCIIISKLGLFLLPVIFFGLINSLKELQYKNSYSEVPFKGYHFLLFRKIRSFDTVNGKIYYLYHSSCERKDIIRVFKKIGIWYKFLSYDVFLNDSSKERITEYIKKIYVDIVNKEKEYENRKSRFNDLNVLYIGTEEEITYLKRTDKLKIILKDESE